MAIMMVIFFILILIISHYFTYGIYIHTKGLLIGPFWGIHGGNPSLPYGFMPFSKIRRIHFSTDNEFKIKILNYYNIPQQQKNFEWLDKQVVFELINENYETMSKSLFNSELDVKKILSSYVHVID